MDTRLYLTYMDGPSFKFCPMELFDGFFCIIFMSKFHNAAKRLTNLLSYSRVILFFFIDNTNISYKRQIINSHKTMTNISFYFFCVWINC